VPILRNDNDRTQTVAAQIYAMRRQRDALFPAGLFSEPAWDMLLEAYQARLQARTLTLKDLACVSHSPSATAHRVLGRLVELGILHRKGNERDQRSRIVWLSDEYSEVISVILNQM